MLLFRSIVYNSFILIGCLLAALCFMRGFLAYLGNLLDLAIFYLHVKNSVAAIPAETEENYEEPDTTPLEVK